MATHIQLSDLQAAIFWNSALLLALIVAFFIQWREIKRLELDMVRSFVMIAVFNVALLLGSRLGAIDPANWERLLWQEHGFHSPGKTMMGGLLLALPLLWLLRKYWHLGGTYADAIIIALPLAAAAVRLGCVAAGCCHGAITTSAFSWTYGPGMPAYEWQLEHGFIAEGAEASLPVYPVQLLFVISCLVLFIFLWHIRKKFKHGGSLALLAVALLLLNRFGIEFFREATTNRGLMGATALGLKAVQWFCLLGGLFSLVMFRRNERKNFEKERLPAYVPLGQMNWIMLFVVTILLLFRKIFSFDEQAFLLLSCVPAIGLLARELWQEWTWLPNRLAATSVLSLTGILFLFTSLDSIPAMQKKGDQWINIGTGGTLGTFKYVYRDCDGDIIDQEQLALSSAGVDAAYHYQFAQKTNVGAGLHGSFGSLSSDDHESQYNYRYSAFGPYLSLNHSWIGLRGGPLFIDHNQLGRRGPEIILDPRNLFSAYLRLGKVHKYHFDVAINDFPGFHYYPEPVVAVGFFNWGFKDYSGATNISLGLVGLHQETGFYISGRLPLEKTMFNLDGGLYIQKGVIFSLGLNYRWRIDE